MTQVLDAVQIVLSIFLMIGIGMFLVGLYLFRWLALFACAMLTMLVSSCTKRLETAYIATCGVIVLPSVLYLFMRLEPLKHLSLALFLETATLIQNMQSLVIILSALGMIIAILVLAYHVLCKKMRI